MAAVMDIVKLQGNNQFSEPIKKLETKKRVRLEIQPVLQEPQPVFPTKDTPVNTQLIRRERGEITYIPSESDISRANSGASGGWFYEVENTTGKVIYMRDRNNDVLPLHPVSAQHMNRNKPGIYITIRKRYRRDYSLEAVTSMVKSITALFQDSGNYLASGPKAIEEYHRSTGTTISNGVGDLARTVFVPYTSLSKYRTVMEDYSGFVFSEDDAILKKPHPESIFAIMQRAVKRTATRVSGFAGFSFEIIDHEGVIGTRYVYMAGRVVEVHPRRLVEGEEQRPDGLYVIDSQSVGTSESFVGLDHYSDFEEGFKAYGLYKTKEEAEANGNPELVNQQSLKETEKELQRLKREAEEARHKASLESIGAESSLLQAKRDYDIKTRELELTHKEALGKIEFENKQRDLDHKEALNKIQQQNMEQEQSHRKAMNDLEARHKETLAALKESHEQALAALRQEVESLKTENAKLTANLDKQVAETKATVSLQEANIRERDNELTSFAKIRDFVLGLVKADKDTKQDKRERKAKKKEQEWRARLQAQEEAEKIRMLEMRQQMQKQEEAEKLRNFEMQKRMEAMQMEHKQQMHIMQMQAQQRAMEIESSKQTTEYLKTGATILGGIATVGAIIWKLFF